MFELKDIGILTVISRSGASSQINLFILLILSIILWSVVVIKFFSNQKLKASFQKWYRQMGSNVNFHDLRKQSKDSTENPLARITQSSLKEIEGLSAYVSYDSLESRSQLVEESVERAVDIEKEKNNRFLTYLSICSAVGPLLGLLGTVWGITNAFIAIGQMGSANITVVAPGIAEALVTTIGGLLVAIPASVFYNYFVAQNKKSEALMYHFGSELVSLFRRGDLSALERSTHA